MGMRGWESSELVAWTDHDGPAGAPPLPRRALWLVTAVTLGVVLSGMLFTDVLCPEHRAWVQALGSLALVCIVVAVVGLIRGWATAPVLTAVASLLGLSIGLLDAAHSPVRGGLIAAGFSVVVLLSGYLALRTIPLRHWDRRLRDQAGSHHSSDLEATTSPAVDVPPVAQPLRPTEGVRVGR